MSKTGMYEVGKEALRRARAKKLDWKQTFRDEEYRVDFPDVSLSIFFDPGLGTYQLGLVNDTGAVVETLVTVVGETDPQQDPGLPEIHELAAAYVREVGINRALQYLKQA